MVTAETQQQVPFKEAFHRIWVAAPTGTIRNVSATFGCLFMLGVQVAVLVMADNTWSLLGLGACPSPAGSSSTDGSTSA